MHDLHRPARPTMRRAAMYLRCRPYDAREADYMRTAMEQLADRFGLPMPDVYSDHGLSTDGPLPALENLLVAAERGWVDAVLVPGPFVFALDDRAAEEIVRRFARAGCEVIEAPGRVVRPVGVTRLSAVPGFGPVRPPRPAPDEGPAAYQAV
ncbi:recombinase family protein [Kitasatospora sp. MBT66]|uniref:recombinase family protein n=1 Tax=Kitasatospora sp. MBT66 TaxID=1444769 RepID=UPI0005BC7E0D|nr:recombinase family protein [Kitasatospora sp. MBT66]